SRTTIGINADGGFAELVRVPARCCWAAPPGAGPDALLLAQPLALVVRAAGPGAPERGGRGADRRSGRVGRRAGHGLREGRRRGGAGGRGLASGSGRRRSAAIATELGAELTHATVDGPLADVARRFSGREGVDLVVETAGTAEAVNHALELVRPGGRVVLTGL